MTRFAARLQKRIDAVKDTVDGVNTKNELDKIENAMKEIEELLGLNELSEEWKYENE